MDAPQIKEILRDVFGNQLQPQVINGWVSIRCFLAPYTHEKGADNSPSAGVSISPKGSSAFSCFVCGNAAPFHVALARYAKFSGENLDDLIEELEEESYLGARELPEWGTPRAALSGVVQAAPPMPINEAIYMGLYDSAVGHPYLRERGISDATARKLELLFDPEDPDDLKAFGITTPRILFPVRGPDGALYGFSGRDVSGKSKLKVRDYCGLKKAQCALGSHLITQDDPDKVLVVEGLFDYANAVECGYPAVAIMKALISSAQIAILRDLGKPTYLFLDNDQAGRDGVAKAGAALIEYVPTMEVRYPKVQIEDDSERGWHWLKDPGEMAPEDFETMIQGARLFEPDAVARKPLTRRRARL